MTIRELRALTVPTEPTGEERLCAKCGSSVNVPPGFDWDDGDWCGTCWTTWGELVRNSLPLLLDIAEAAEEMRFTLSQSGAAPDQKLAAALAKLRGEAPR